MKIIITGAGGNVGRSLIPELIARRNDIVVQNAEDLDLTQPDAFRRSVAEFRPDLVIHCAAMTDVDRCALDPDEALRVNGLGTQYVALACQRFSAALCYLSTNEVFDGERAVPYLEYDPTHPANPYAYSKWMGEQIVQELVAQHYIVRISWLFAHGGQNFLQKIVAAAQADRPLRVVTDEVASPTYADDLAPALARLVETGQYGIYHLANDGWASRYAFAEHILACFGLPGYPITPIVRAQYPRPSRPPTYSALRNFMAAQLGIRLRPWQDAVAAFAERERALENKTKPQRLEHI